MSPTYTVPTAETIHPGEQMLTADSQHDLQSGQQPDRRLQSRRSLYSRTNMFGRKHRSCSPQVHPLLKDPLMIAATEEPHTADGIPSPKPRLRRYSSIDSPHPRLGSREDSDDEVLRRPRGSQRKRLSPSSKRPVWLRPRSFDRADLHLPSSIGSSSPIKESCSEDDEYGSKARLNGALRCLEDNVGSTIARDPSVCQDPSDEPARACAGADASKTSLHTVRIASSGSSTSSGDQSAALSQTTVDTELSIVNGEEISFPAPTNGAPSLDYAQAASRSRRQSRADQDRYGTPEMPRGPAKLPHVPVSELAPRVPKHGHPKHLPRAEKLPMSGYELLASTISSSAAPPAPRNKLSTFLDKTPTSRRKAPRRHSSSSANLRFFRAQHTTSSPLAEDGTIKPIYRRFESLNHRLLLHLQDELSELEEQLHRLDTTDTQTRRVQSSILPASRRAESLAGGELQSHKTDILSKIAFKLGQYNDTLSSFTSTRDLPAPSHSVVDEYREYLAKHRPISDAETRFLDSTDDLITLEAPVGQRASSPSSSIDEPRLLGNRQSCPRSLRLADNQEHSTVTPIPGTMHGNSWLRRHGRLSSGSRSQASSPGGSDSSSYSGARSSPSSPKFAIKSGHRATINSLRLPPPPPSPLRHTHRPSSASSVADGGKQQKGEEEVEQQQRASAPIFFHKPQALTVAMAVLVSVLMFLLVPGFVANIILVLLIGLLGVGVVAHRVSVKPVADSSGDYVPTAGFYAGMRAVVASMMT